MRERDWLCPVLAGLVSLSPLGLGGARLHGQEVKKHLIEFNRHIRPILSDNCFACHGPDKNQRKADLRLDSESDAFADRGGYSALVKGKPDTSELFKRITRSDKSGRMPPAKTGKHLTAQQVELIRQWIEQGAKYEKHWSLIPPQHRPVPKVAEGEQPRNVIDAFVRWRMEMRGLAPSPEADRRTLARRLSFDLVGLPPSPEQVEAFVKDASPQACATYVDRLLASKHYGERMAIYWLDVVRFADTNGIHGDNHREIAPYRDYVIDAFNNNKPFDRFVTEQLAGDLLPNPTNEQKIASGFNRLLMTTREGGAQPKEYLAKYSADRVRNTASIFLGYTMGCCECHDHKFDPLTQKDFYSFAAFFADIKDVAVGEQPMVRLPTPEQENEIRKIDSELASLRAQLDRPLPELDNAQARWEQEAKARRKDARDDWIILKPEKLASSGKATLAIQPDHSVLSTGKNPAQDVYTVTLRTDQKQLTGIRLEALSHPSFGNPGLARGNGNFVLTRFEVSAAKDGAKPQPVKIVSAAADYEQPGFPVVHAIDADPKTGWAVDGHAKRGDRMAVFAFDRPLPGGPGTVLVVRLRHESQYTQHNIGRFRLSLTSAAKPALSGKNALLAEVAQALGVETSKRTPQQKQTLTRYFRSIAPQLEPQRRQLAVLEKRKDDVVKAEPQTEISMAGPPRTIRILRRGNWLDDAGEIVEPNTPASLLPLGVKGRRADRLDLAKWMVSPDNPVVARVFVNRLWKLFFGQGIVKPLDDYGSQGAWPTHPDLLDWLAIEFRESGWDVKHLVKLMVLSETYRQTSKASEKLKQADPYNQWLARQGRFRLDAEMVRDNALAVSGLLVHKIGGRSVKPYQPAGYWAHLNFPIREWQKDSGEELYRRGVYTYWCRTFLHPSLVAFDAPSREECVVERPRSNTPQQALVLLNDPVYVEAARVLAERIVRHSGKDADARLRFAFRQVLQRSPQPTELKLLQGLVVQHLEQYRKDRAGAAELMKIGDFPVPKDLDVSELAAWTSVARVLLNLHETITRN
ncbi:MAG: PSD1 domain-containing protein [Planctomycetes bacterium]|nr:PSD1 domain-containing protein [Planctomycetota bacterium]